MTAKRPYETTLTGAHVRVDPVRRGDAEGLFAALSDPSVWTWLASPPPHDVATMQTYVDEAIADRESGARFTWVVRTLDGTVAGWSSYGDIEPHHGRIEIGWTAYGPAFQRTAVNTETKLLLLGHAFEDLGYQRVALKTDGRNGRSQAAIARIGAVREGVLRRHIRRPDGTMRDSVYFSVLSDEWPEVRARLEERLARG